MVKWLIEKVPKMQINKGRWEKFHTLPKNRTVGKIKVGKCGGEVRNWVVEIFPKSKVSEMWRELGNRVVKICAKI